MTRSAAARRPRSAGILLYRWVAGQVEVLLGHPGGPYWVRKDEGAWMVPKGAVEAGETGVEAAVREFGEEVGPLPPGNPTPLVTVRQNGGKLVEVFAMAGDFDPAGLSSSPFEMEWPPRSGQLKQFPELDRVEWMSLPEARHRVLRSQLPVIDALERSLGGAPRQPVEKGAEHGE